MMEPAPEHASPIYIPVLSTHVGQALEVKLQDFTGFVASDHNGHRPSAELAEKKATSTDYLPAYLYECPFKEKIVFV